jgi:carnitine-CoA ligase
MLHDPAEKTVIELLRRQAAERPDAPFLDDPGASVTYARAYERSDHLAAGFAAAGVGEGDLVAVFMLNSIDYVLATLALAKLGAVPVTVNTEYKGELLRYVLGDCGARLAVVEDELLEHVLALDLAGLPLETVAVRGPFDADAPAGVALHPLAALEESGASGPVPAPVERLAGDRYMVIYTSGTTGPSKGVLISNGHCLAFASDWVRALEFGEDDVLYSPLPLFHGIAYLLGAMATLVAGARMHIRRRFSITRFWSDVRETDATVAHLIFAIVPMLLAQPESDGDRDHALRAVYIGPSKLSEAFEQRFGAPVVEVYGQTETGVVTLGPLGELPPGSCGRVNAERFEAKVVDALDRELPPGEPGEIVVRPRHPDTMMLGYLNKAEATVETFRNLWHHTGDRATMDADGWLYFLDRVKDCIRRRGENISSYEIELVVGKLPGVGEVAAIPVPSELSEEEVKICVVAVAGAEIDPAELHSACVASLPKFMVPRYIEVCAELPKTPSQKVEKYKLRAEGADGITAATWDSTAQATVSA